MFLNKSFDIDACHLLRKLTRRRRFVLLLAAFFLFFSRLSAQQNDYDFVVEKLKTSYVGFKERTIGMNFDSFARVTLIRCSPDTFKAMAVLTNFFRDGHCTIYSLEDEWQLDTAQNRKSLAALRSYLDGKTRKRPREGYWLNDYNNLVLALRQESSNPMTYVGYVTESVNNRVVRGRRIRLEQAPNGSFFTDYFSGSSGKRHFVNSFFRNDSVFTAGAEHKWKKLRRYHSPMLNGVDTFSEYSIGKQLDSLTYLITIPASSAENIDTAAAIVKRDSALISRSKYLIVDIRNNQGGYTQVYRPLLPFIATGPIPRDGQYTYCTKDLIQHYKKKMKRYMAIGEVDSTGPDPWENWYKLVHDSLGKLLLYIPDTTFFDSIMPMPQQVGVVMNYADQSASEMLLSEFCYSKKVTLFGEHTMGVLDHVDWVPITVPSGKYQLLPAGSKRKIPEGNNPVDNVGIYPDVPINDTVEDWLSFVRDYYQDRKKAH